MILRGKEEKGKSDCMDKRVFVISRKMREDFHFSRGIARFVKEMLENDSVVLSSTIELSDIFDRMRDMCGKVYNCPVSSVNHGKLDKTGTLVVSCTVDSSNLVFLDGKERKVYK